MTSKYFRLALALAALGALSFSAQAQLVISDTLTGTSSSYNWKSLNGACLTAGNNSVIPPATSPIIPACVGLAYYSGKTQVGGVSGRLPDAAGSGALRLTNGDTQNGGSNGDNQTGAIVSNFTFPTTQGLQVTFTTATYGGDGGTGADGISFFLSDGSQAPSVGGLGGSLGYSCSNVNGSYNGVVGAYIGVGIDEYGNFSNRNDNTSSGPGFQAGRISLRGAGSTAFASLSTSPATSAYYPTTLNASDQQSAVQNTCRTGTIWNYSGNKIGNVNNKNDTTIQLAYNYPFLLGSNLPAGFSLSNQQGMNMPVRGNATPITYGLKLTQDGLLSLSYSVNGGIAQNVLTNQSITASNGPLPASFRFGFSAGTGGSNNVHEIMCFKAAQINAAASSAGINIQQSAKVQVGTQVYLAYYHPVNWWGQLTAQNLVEDATTSTVSINPVANWDASCVLTGGACSATGAASTPVQGSSSRNVLTWNGSAGIPLLWLGLSAAQKSALDPTAGTTATSSTRLDYLRGDRTQEIGGAANGPFRARNSVLGDIVSSSPTWVGAPNLPYKGIWKDALRPTTSMPEGSSYGAYATSNATRTNVVYAGANDGLLHGFRAGAYDSSGNFNTAAANDGNELLAYMPAQALNTIHATPPTAASLDYSSPQYSHNAFVDATPGTGDLYYQGGWHTWLAGGLGDGGNAGGVIGDNTTVATGGLYVLDVTNPGNFSEANAASLVIGDWTSTSASLTCPTDTSSTFCRDNLGSTFGTPIIRRLHDGNWAVIFGNGLNSKSGKAGVFVMTVDQTTGAKSFRFLDTGVGTATARNGIAYVASADLDGDHVTDYFYAGDVLGNMWRFDVTGATGGSWSARSTPIFNTGGLPITTRATVNTAATSSGTARVIVGFGTGQIFPQTQTAAATPVSGTQYIFGIWDWDMASWNSLSGVQYSSLTAPQTVNAGVLQTQTTATLAYSTGGISGVRTVTQYPICWKGATTCSGGNSQFGWKLALPGTNEQVVYNPVLSDGMFVVNTAIPGATQALTCGSQPASGYTMAITADTGAAATSSYFADASNNYVTTNGLVLSGVGLSAVGSPSFVTTATKKYLVNQTVSGVGSVTQVNPGANSKGGRVTWIKLR